MSKQAAGAKGGPDSSKCKGPSLPVLFGMFSDNQTAAEWLEWNVRPDGRMCPQCGYKYTRTTKHPSMPYYCSECDKRFNVKIGTVMEHSGIGYWGWAIATCLLAIHSRAYPAHSWVGIWK
ncbi:MAG: hypothetical protein IS632_03340 [Thaumarchaeota archaeon]|nr:hypothetical protein [Nitrososphaerota archaeon]